MTRFLFITLFHTLFLVLITHTVTYAEEVKLLIDDYCPAICLSEPTSPGVSVELINEVYSEAGVEIHFERINWVRGLEDAFEMGAAGYVGVPQMKNTDLFFHDEPIYMGNDSFFVRKRNKWIYQGIESLEGLRIGVGGADFANLGYSDPLLDYVMKHLGTPAIQAQYGLYPDALDRMINMLLEGRIDTLIEDEHVLAYGVRRLSVGHLVKFAGKGFSAPLYIGFIRKHKDSRRLARILDKGIREKRLSGRLDEILTKYGIKDWNRSE